MNMPLWRTTNSDLRTLKKSRGDVSGASFNDKEDEVKHDSGRGMGCPL